MKRFYASFLAVLFTALAFAQQGGADVNVDVTKSTETSTGGFPWLWVIIGIVVLILLIVLLGGGGGSRGTDVVEKKTVIKD